MYSCTFEKGWVGRDCHFIAVNVWVVLACESLHVCTVCVWHCENARLCVEGFYAPYITCHSFIHLFIHSTGWGKCNQADRQRLRHRDMHRERERGGGEREREYFITQG